MDKQRDFVLRTIEERGVKFIRLWFTDVVGALKMVAITPAEVEGAFAEGLGFDGSAIEGFTRAYEAGLDALMEASTRVQKEDPAWHQRALRRGWMRHWPGVLSV